MKIRIQAAITVILLIITTISVIAVDSDDGQKILPSIKKDHFLFSQATIETKEAYVSVDVAEVDTFLMQTGKPMLPVFIKTFTFPLGTKIKSVNCTPMDISEMKISGKIKPAPKSAPKMSVKKPMSDNDNKQIIEDKSVYSTLALYPDSWYDYSIHCGRKNDQSVIILTVRSYPLRYAPMKNVIYQKEGVDVMLNLGIDKELAVTLEAIAKEKIQIALVNVKGIMELQNPKPKGVLLIKETLKTVEAVGESEGADVTVYLVSPPKYRVVVSAEDYKSAERVLDRVTKSALKTISKSGGTGSFKREK